jgi:hypothetical protein
LSLDIKYKIKDDWDKHELRKILQGKIPDNVIGHNNKSVFNALESVCIA